MRVYSYRVEHDLGLAPNPFGGYCTLAVCKPEIRKSTKLQIGDWIIGTGSVALGNDKILIYLMQIDEKLTFQEYWEDERFMLKKPKIPGSLVQMHGDNFYHQYLETNEWIQEHSVHCQPSGAPSPEHMKKDLGGKYVLISKRFFYFGDSRLKIPHELLGIRKRGIGHRVFDVDEPIAQGILNWIVNTYPLGIHGDPINWKTDPKYILNQLSLF